jgi:hypothetical protein
MPLHPELQHRAADNSEKQGIEKIAESLLEHQEDDNQGKPGGLAERERENWLRAPVDKGVKFV